MRFSDINLYSSSTFKINNILSERLKANDIISSGKKINKMADDAVGFSEVLNIKTSISSMEQYTENLNVASQWLKEGEAALTEVKKVIDNAKALCSKMINGHQDTSAYQAATLEITSYINEIYYMANQQVGSAYIFAGTKNNSPAFSRDSETNPTKITYMGNDKNFEIKFDPIHNVSVGGTGKAIFGNERIKVTSVNNTIVFKEKMGSPPNDAKIITATIPEGEYEPKDIMPYIKKAMDQASKKDGYGISYEVSYDTTTGKTIIQDDGKNNNLLEFSLLFKTGYNARAYDIQSSGITPKNVSVELNELSKMKYSTKESNTGLPMQFEYVKEGDSSVWKLSNDPGYNIMPQQIKGDATKILVDFDNDGFNEIAVNLKESADIGDIVSFHIEKQKLSANLGEDLGFNEADFSKGATNGLEVAYRDSSNKISISKLNNKMDFRETSKTGDKKVFSIEVAEGNYTSDELALAIEIQMEKISREKGNGINYTVAYDKNSSSYLIKENGTKLSKFEVLWTTGPNRPKDKGGSGQSLADTLGFSNLDTKLTTTEGQNEIRASFFDTFFNLKQQCIEEDAQGIAKILGRLEMQFNHINKVVLEYGNQYNLIERKLSVQTEVKLSLQNRRSEIEDADVVESYMKLQQIDSTYNAALSSISKIMNLSLVDYIK